jgi:hypothetical protein
MSSMGVRGTDHGVLGNTAYNERVYVCGGE